MLRHGPVIYIFRLVWTLASHRLSRNNWYENYAVSVAMVTSVDMNRMPFQVIHICTYCAQWWALILKLLNVLVSLAGRDTVI
jgi:uncharacterized membrane protein